MLNNIAIVTGGSSGIGAEFARQLAERGYNLLLVSNQDDALITTKNELLAQFPNIECITLYKDLSQAEAANEIFDFCNDNQLQVEVLINDAGIFSFKQVIDHSQSHINLYIDLHIRVVTQLCRLFGEQMKERRHGYILNMSSMSCWMPMPGICLYSATKAYIRVLSRALYFELKQSGVGVTVACPGGIDTELFGLSKPLRRLGVRLGALATPESFVKGALIRMFNHKKQYINGLFNRISIILVANLPSPVVFYFKHKLLDKS